MKTYLISLCVGILVGAIYALLNVRSPAPPVVALLGLLGMLMGEQVTSIAKARMQTQSTETNRATQKVGQIPQDKDAKN
jgi:XapX domain-containing protein